MYTTSLQTPSSFISPCFLMRCSCTQVVVGKLVGLAGTCGRIYCGSCSIIKGCEVALSSVKLSFAKHFSTRYYIIQFIRQRANYDQTHLRPISRLVSRPHGSFGQKYAHACHHCRRLAMLWHYSPYRHLICQICRGLTPSHLEVYC